MGLGGLGVASGRLGAGRRSPWGAGEGLLMALLPAIRAQEVLGHAFSCHIRGAGPGGPCAGMPGSRLAGATRRPGSRLDTPAKLAGTAFGCGSRPRRRAHPSRGGLWASLKGCPVPGQRWVSFPGDGRLSRRRGASG